MQEEYLIITMEIKEIKRLFFDEAELYTYLYQPKEAQVKVEYKK